MTTGSNQNPEGEGDPPAGATEPLTLTDPDGAITLIAPWSTWTREQVRAPGGQPSMVTRLDQGQLWFSSGRPRSPWRHEVKVGTASVSTRDGRFHVTAEPDGGATVDCLSGTTTVTSGLQAPVVLGADQTAAVASDGATLVVLDAAGRGAAAEDVADTALDLTDSGSLAGSGSAGAGSTGAAAAGVAAGAIGAGVGSAAAAEAAPAEGDGADGGEVPVAAGAGGSGDGPGKRERATRLPEVVAVAALLAVLVAAVVVFGRQPEYDDVEVAQPVSTSTSEVPRTTERPSTTLATSTTAVTTSTAPSTTAPSTTAVTSTTTVPRTLTNPAQATGLLAACKRAEGGVVATINVRLRSGGPGQFKVGVGLVGTDGQVFATGEARTAVIQQGGSAPVDVLVAVPGPARGACELLGVEAV